MDHRLPDWVDRRTIEWCAQICESVGTRLLFERHAPERAKAADHCAVVLRALATTGRPLLPVVVDHRG